MAKANAAIVILNLTVLMLALLLIASDGRMLISAGALDKLAEDTTPICNSIYSVRLDDTCFAISQQFHLTPEAFNSINPNLNCDKMFVGHLQ
ncbi:hypothetical protein QJS04_geneDACA003183 [Acorus gramineus]|uniref:LysM domain-containing protein n=1 Tax=Acorus gramineus TaxID=55184 RepID=A0AAV9BWP2_ACOGR|nr:hypothetical protein QJS04_geneDACA003183 [Acorus gramineus]